MLWDVSSVIMTTFDPHFIFFQEHQFHFLVTTKYLGCQMYGKWNSSFSVFASVVCQGVIHKLVLSETFFLPPLGRSPLWISFPFSCIEASIRLFLTLHHFGKFKFTKECVGIRMFIVPQSLSLCNQEYLRDFSVIAQPWGSLYSGFKTV